MKCHTWTFYLLPNIPKTSHVINQCISNVQNMGSYLPNFLSGLNSPHTKGDTSHMCQNSSCPPLNLQNKTGDPGDSWRVLHHHLGAGNMFCVIQCVLLEISWFLSTNQISMTIAYRFSNTWTKQPFLLGLILETGQVVIHSTNLCC